MFLCDNRNSKVVASGGRLGSGAGRGVDWKGAMEDFLGDGNSYHPKHLFWVVILQACNCQKLRNRTLRIYTFYHVESIPQLQSSSRPPRLGCIRVRIAQDLVNNAEISPQGFSQCGPWEGLRKLHF